MAPALYHTGESGGLIAAWTPGAFLKVHDVSAAYDIEVPWPRAWPGRQADGRTHQKVRRDSREALPNEPAEFFTWAQCRERLRAFDAHARQVRIPGRRRGGTDPATRRPDGTYSTIARQVLEHLMGFAVRHGRIFPAYDEIAREVGCTLRTAVRVVAQLVAGGWLRYERRLVRVGSPGAAEPQVQQTSNFYRLCTPRAAVQLIESFRRRRPPNPDDAPARLNADQEADHLQAERRRAQAERDAEGFSPAERTKKAAVAQRMREALDRLGEAAERRASAEASPAAHSVHRRDFPEG